MAGSDYPYLDSPGSVRLYAKVEGAFSTHKWFASAKLGKSFVTNGPLIDFKVDEYQAGDEISLSQPTKLTVRATVLHCTVAGRVARRYPDRQRARCRVIHGRRQ